MILDSDLLSVYVSLYLFFLISLKNVHVGHSFWESGCLTSEDLKSRLLASVPWASTPSDLSVLLSAPFPP